MVGDAYRPNEQPRAVSVKLDFLDPNQAYLAKIYRDGKDAHYKTNPESYAIESISVTSESTIEAQLAASGGMAVTIFKVKK